MKIHISNLQPLLFSLIVCSGFSFIMPFRIYMILTFLCISLYSNLKQNHGVPKSKICFWVFIFVLLIMIGLGYSYDKTETFKYLLTYMAGACLIFFPQETFFYEKSIYLIDKICKIDALSIVIQIFIPNLYRDYLFFLIRGGRSAIPRLNNEISQHIYSGILGEKGEAAFLMVIAIVLTLSRCAYQKRIDRKDFIWLCIYFIALILPAKRMLFAVAIMVLMLFFIMWIGGSKKVLAIAGAGLLGSIAYVVMSFIPAFNTLLARFTAFADNDTANGRTYLWEYAMTMFHNKPLMGYGYGSYNKFASEIGVVLTESRIWESHAHNVYYQLLSEMGIVGLITFLLMNVATIAAFFKLYKCRNGLSQDSYKFLFIGINIVIVCLVYGLTGNVIYYTNQIMIYMWGVSLLNYLILESRRKKV